MWNQDVSLSPLTSIPAPEPTAAWKSVDTTCCIVSYISGTAADRDLEMLKNLVDTQAADVERRMGTKSQKKIPVTYFPRTLGHGGFAADGIYISYLDRNYAGSSAAQVTHHEMVHWLDSQLGGKLRPSILQEGLAVYMSDGHFKNEPIISRATALVDLGWYIPLRELTDTFYRSQHEVGYIEAAALISYMVTTYGWKDYNSFYRAITPAPGGSESVAMDTALQARFGISLDQLEQNFKVYLKNYPVDNSIKTDMRLTVNFYNTVRRYQAALDPSAYFLYAWLPDVARMRKLNIVADFLRHPDSLLNRQIEDLLVSGNVDLIGQKYESVEFKIHMANVLLDMQAILDINK